MTTLPDSDGVDAQMVAASLCYLITRYQKKPSADLSLVVKRHLQMLLKMSDVMSPEAHSTYQKLLKLWQEINPTRCAGCTSAARDNRTIH